MKRQLFLLFMLPMCLPAFAQWTTITGANLRDAVGNKVTGQICLLGTDANDQPISYKAGREQVIKKAVCASVNNGVIESLQVADSTLTSPTNVCYRITVTDKAGALVLRYPQANQRPRCGSQPSGTSWSFDAFNPNYAPLALIETAPTGPQGLQGPVGPTGPTGGATNLDNGSTQGQIAIWDTGAGKYKPQSKAVIDVRDCGVKGNLSTDDTSAIQTCFNNLANYSALVIPAGLKMKISSTITLLNKIGIKVIFEQEADAAMTQAAPSGFYWWGPAGGTVLYLNQVHGSEWHGLVIHTDGGGTAFPSTPGANRGVLLDETGTINNITTDNTFVDGYIQNYNHNDSLVAVDIGVSAPGNVENNLFHNFKVICEGGTPANNNAVGFRWGGGGSQPDNTIIERGGAANCGKAFYARGNSKLVKIRDMTLSGNYNDLYYTGGADLLVEGVRTENAIQSVNIAASPAGALTLRKLEFAGTGAPQISVMAGAGGQLVLEDISFAGTGVQALSLNGGGGSMTIIESGSEFFDSTFVTNLALAGFGSISSSVGTGGYRSIPLLLDSAPFTAGNITWKTDSCCDIGAVSHRARDVYAGRAFRTGTTSNTDSSGTISVSSSTNGSTKFSKTYTTAPRCVITPTSDPTSVGVWWVTSSTTGVTANVKTSSTITFNYWCTQLN